MVQDHAQWGSTKGWLEEAGKVLEAGTKSSVAVCRAIGPWSKDLEGVVGNRKVGEDVRRAAKKVVAVLGRCRGGVRLERLVKMTEALALQASRTPARPTGRGCATGKAG